MLVEDTDFYKIANQISLQAGLCSTIAPRYYNVAPVGFYLNYSNQGIVLDDDQRNYFNKVNNISELFVLDNNSIESFKSHKVGVFSYAIDVSQKDRSIAAYDIHSFFHFLSGYDISIVFVKHLDNMMVTVKSTESECYLSDWYSIDDCDELIEKLFIYELDIDSIQSFYESLLFSVVRDYYKQSYNSDYLPYIVLPEYYINNSDLDKVDKDEIKGIVEDFLNQPIIKYGYDYVYYNSSIINIQFEEIEISEDDDLTLDLEYLRLEEAKEDRLKYDDFEEINEEESEDESYYDDFELDDIDERVFDDPELMLKWLYDQE